ncbi:MAG: N-6 DNA methylase [Chloroflexi bacterium]|nr:N-6 DNA methylase [Chloroflexota bacterium]
MNTLETYRKIHLLAPEFARFIRQAVRQAHNEAEFERQMNNEIERLAGQLGTPLLFREQYTLATGRADAVYNRLVIEYEPPGSLRDHLSHQHTAHAVRQVKEYIEGLAKAERHDRDRLLGVAFDGHYFIFARYHQGHWIVEPPLEVNEASCERFLRSLFSLASGRALIPENLVEDFGNQNVLSQQVTGALYRALEQHPNSLTARLFEQWQLFFGETAGAEAAAGKLAHRSELRAFLKGMGLKPENADLPRFFFALQTYFAFIVKNIARLVLQAYAAGGLGATPLTTVAGLQGRALQRELQKWEEGDFYRALGLKNLLEGDFFAWYLHAWDADVEVALRQVLQRLAEYNPVTVQDDPLSARDLLKKLYHYLLPREIRHDLGEFYTPDWLAERLLAQLGEPLFQMPKPGARIPTPNKRLLDPACGSGTFLILAARALKANCFQAGLAEADTLEVILNSLAGLDLNPLAVMAARVNFLLAIADLLPYRRREVEIPIYLADSILTPAEGKELFDQGRRILETAVGALPIPAAVDTRAEMERLTDLLEAYVRGGFASEVFLERCRAELPDLSEQDEATLRDLFETLRGLHQQGLDGIWARVVKNAFMPLFLEPFDYVVGNPPWINWESLPQGYRQRVAPLWQKYGLFQHKGFDAILGKSKDDISALMTYVAADRYLKPGGKLAFVITQSVWKTSGAGQGFRRFRLGEAGEHLQVVHVDDLSRLQVFEGASTRTSVFVLRKGEATRYPVPYTYWQKTSRGQGLDYDSTLEEVLQQTRRLQFQAAPVDRHDPTSAWLTARPRALTAIQKVLGPSEYQARAGVTTWANGVYWLEKIAARPDGLWVVRNLTEGAKREVESVTVELEPDLLYPLLRGRDVRRWQAQPSAYILVTHLPDARLNAIPVKELQTRYPKTWAYLKRFEKELRERSGFQRYFTRKQGQQVIETGPFYSIFNVGEYTFAPWKVVWREQSAWFTVAVVNEQEQKCIVPDHKLMLIDCPSEEEAFYLASVLNSSPTTLAVWAYSISIQQTTHITDKIAVPRFDAQNPTHTHLAALSQEAHQVAPAAYAGDAAAQRRLAAIEAEIDGLAARLWGLTDEELAEIRASLQELKGW